MFVLFVATIIFALSLTKFEYLTNLSGFRFFSDTRQIDLANRIEASAMQRIDPNDSVDSVKSFQLFTSKGDDENIDDTNGDRKIINIIKKIHDERKIF